MFLIYAIFKQTLGSCNGREYGRKYLDCAIVPKNIERLFHDDFEEYLEEIFDKFRSILDLPC